MTDEIKEALKEYLRENLTVDVSCGYGFYSSDRTIKVVLRLDGEEFSTSYDNLPDNS